MSYRLINLARHLSEFGPIKPVGHISNVHGTDVLQLEQICDGIVNDDQYQSRPGGTTHNYE